MKKYIIPILLALAVIAGFWSYHKGYTEGKKKAVETIITQIDTVVRYDSIKVVEPKYVAVKVVDTIRVPVPIPGKTDTLWAELPREQKTYAEDSLYVCEISGVQPELESITVFQKTQYINNTVYVPTKDTRKDYVELDARLMWDKQFLAPVTLNIGHKFGPLDMSAGAGYDFITRTPVGQIDAKLQFKF